jgi:hypothetical protein
MPGLRLEPDIQAAPSGLSRGLSLGCVGQSQIKSGGAHEKAESVVFTSAHRIKQIISSNAGENAVRFCTAMIQLSFSEFMAFIIP